MPPSEEQLQPPRTSRFLDFSRLNIRFDAEPHRLAAAKARHLRDSTAEYPWYRDHFMDRDGVERKIPRVSLIEHRFSTCVEEVGAMTRRWNGIGGFVSGDPPRLAGILLCGF